jgi:hypothetical protein
MHAGRQAWHCLPVRFSENVARSTFAGRDYVHASLKRNNMRDATLPIALSVPGVAWLLNSLDWLPDVHWIWVAGPLLILAGFLFFCRQYYGMGWRFMIPVMLISAGLPMLVARSARIPDSRNFNPDVQCKPQDRDSHG